MQTGTGCKQRRTSASVGGRHVTMPALPTMPFVVLQSQFLFQSLTDVFPDPCACMFRSLKTISQCELQLAPRSATLE
jgi:hypothetical protein